MTNQSVLVLLAGLTGLVGCGSSKPPAAKTASSGGDTSSSSATTGTHDSTGDASSASTGPTTASVYIDSAILKACGIAEADAHFAFDSAHVLPGDTRTLDAVATCFASGPLKGRSMQLVGHADPRGDNDYNFQLGQQRADAVAGFERSKGVPAAQTSSTSRGAMDASGTDEATWARDRRVDVRLVP